MTQALLTGMSRMISTHLVLNLLASCAANYLADQT
jgi:hypothetical protein